ncbi:MAG: hypothetical protein FJ086_05915 [Deltaproteobacteria bacterium]|nr:hypothetical protein [Deltaproteobacteria bacterium]
MSPRPPARKGTPAWVLLAVAVPALAFTTWGAVSGVYSSGVRAQRRSLEPSLNVRQLCQYAAAHHARTGQWVAAGPFPAHLPAPGETVPFVADEGFRALGFHPGVVRFQYAVEVERAGDAVRQVRCVARGDADRDGVPAVFSLEVDPATSELSPVRAENPEE